VANFPAFRLNQQSVGRAFMMNLLSSAAPLRENQFVGANYSRYRNPELDTLTNRFVVTVRPEERSPIVQQIVRLTTEQAVLIGLFSNASAILVANRIHGVTADKPGWNIHLWDVS
jgi:ABC-type transport system substrate-binding protein